MISCKPDFPVFSWLFAQGKSVISIVQDATSFAGQQSSQDDTGHFRMKFCYSGRVAVRMTQDTSGWSLLLRMSDSQGRKRNTPQDVVIQDDTSWMIGNEQGMFVTLDAWKGLTWRIRIESLHGWQKTNDSSQAWATKTFRRGDHGRPFILSAIYRFIRSSQHDWMIIWPWINLFRLDYIRVRYLP